MLRALLSAVCLALLVLFVVGLRHNSSAAAPAAVVPRPVPPPAPASPAAPPPIGLLVPIDGAGSVVGATPALDMIDRLATRRRLAREGNNVYLDSMLVHTDSVLTRWADRRTLRVAFVADTSVPGWSPALIAEARAAMHAWDDNGSGLMFQEVPVGDSADILVHWVRNLDDSTEDGRTMLSWGGDGVVNHASILLGLTASDSLPLSPAVRRRVAVHEFGHALGLPHSGDDEDVMFRTSPLDEPSQRDQATLRLLYALPPGPLRIPPQQVQP